MEKIFSIAFPTGRMSKWIGDLLVGTKYELPEDPSKTRKLILELPEENIRYIMVKPADVAVYVARGVADVGIIGKDRLDEDEVDVFELMDLKVGGCTMSVAAPEDYEEDTSRAVRVATSFPNIAEKYYKSIHREAEIIRLNGSIEVAPLLDLSDVIVDLVQTGTTLRENNLKVTAEILESSARLIANISSYRFKRGEIDELMEILEQNIE